MIPKKLAPAEAGVADFSDKIMREIKENRERCRFNFIEKRSKGRLGLPLRRGGLSQEFCGVLYQRAKSSTRHCEEAKPTKQSRVHGTDYGLLRCARNDGQ
jgi:hypothetical protein